MTYYHLLMVIFLCFFLQMAKFRLMKSSEKDASGVKQYLVDNYRPVQNLNQRRVSSTFLVGAANNVRFSLVFMVMCVMSAVLQRFL